MVAVETPSDSFRKLFTHPLLQGCVLVVVALVIALTLQMPNRFPDPDSFYHAGMAELAAAGEFPIRFPWLDLTTLRSTYADLHLLYHIILVPFVALFGAMPGIRIATIAGAILAPLAFFMLLRRLRIRGALAFTLLLLGSASFAFRLNLAKAQAFAFIVLFLGIIALVRRSRTGVFLAAVFAAWMSAHWPVYLAAVVVFAFHHVFATVLSKPRASRALFVAAREAFGIVMSAFAGIAAGFIVNPYFPGNITVAWQQIVEIALIGGSATVNVGIEWHRLTTSEFVRSVGFLLPLLALAVVGAIVRTVRCIQRETTDDRDALAQTYTFGTLALAFAILAFRQQRQLEFFIPFAVLACASGLQPFVDWWWPPRVITGWRQPGMIRRPLATFMLIVVIVGFGVGAWNAMQPQRAYFRNGFSGDRFSGVTAWLRANVPANAVVFHGDWDDFPFLFLHDRTHRYLVGLDPRFAVLANVERYERWAMVSRGETSNAAAVIRREFGAEYAVVARGQEALAEVLARDPSVRLVYEDGDGKVFALAQ